jgi:hypothetical protein
VEARLVNLVTMGWRNVMLTNQTRPKFNYGVNIRLGDRDRYRMLGPKMRVFFFRVGNVSKCPKIVAPALAFCPKVYNIISFFLPPRLFSKICRGRSD